MSHTTVPGQMSDCKRPFACHFTRPTGLGITTRVIRPRTSEPSYTPRFQDTRCFQLQSALHWKGGRRRSRFDMAEPALVVRPGHKLPCGFSRLTLDNPDCNRRTATHDGSNCFRLDSRLSEHTILHFEQQSNFSISLPSNLLQSIPSHFLYRAPLE
jgi:hypothetical protein